MRAETGVRVRQVLAAAWVTALPALAPAATYYVSPAGKDTNSGTSTGSPFKTMGKAAAVAVAGDTVYVRKGTYSESVTYSTSGTAAKPIQFIADTSGAIFGLKGNVVLKKPGGTAATVNGSYIRFYNFRFAASSVNVAWNASTGGLLDTCLCYSATGDGLQVKGATLTLNASKFYSNKDDGVEVQQNSSVTMTGCTIYSNKNRGVYIAPPAGGGGGGGAVVVGTGGTVTMSKPTIYSNTSHGVYNDGGDVTILNGLIYKNKACGVCLGTTAGTSLTSWNCTVGRNTSDGIQQNGGSATIRNFISAYNTGKGLNRASASAMMTHSHGVLFGNTGGAYAGTVAGVKELLTDPKFTSTTVYTILAGSSAIDNGATTGGLVTADLVGVSRPQGLSFDCGCYEGPGAILFTDVSSATGFGVVTTSSENDGSGLHWADVNGDGYLDCMVTGSSPRLMINNHGASFSPLALSAARRQGAWIDADNDGDPDFFASCKNDYNTEALWVNTAGSFSTTGDAGMTSPTGNEAVAAADVDGDGWCDLVMFSANGNWTGINQKSATPAFVASKALGLNAGGSTGDGDYGSSADVNGDGRPDFLYHYSGGQFFLSNGDGTYSLDNAAGLNFSTGTTKKIGSAFADYDEDGQVDVFVPAYSANNPGFLWNNDAGVFTDNTDEAGLTDSTVGQRGCCWGDINNDGHLDLYICNRGGPNQLYLNNGDGTFTLVDGGAAVSGDFQDCCMVDYDNDGDLDIALTRQDGANVLLRNGTNDSNYLKVRVVGAGSRATNTLGVGVRVELWDASGTDLLQRREIGGARGYGGTEPLWAHFGGVTSASNYVVKVYFLNGTISTTVKPSTTASTIGSTVVPQMLTVTEPPVSLRVTSWKEVESE